MCHNTTQFVFERLLILACILSDPIDADVNLTGYSTSRGGVLKRDDVRKRIVIEELLIHFKQLAVGNENVIEINDRFLVPARNELQPKPYLGLVA